MEELKCRGYAGDVPVYCAHDKIVPIAEVKPNPKNPNQHSVEQIELLAKIIKTQGWRAPVTVSTLSGLVVRGHGRLMAAKHLRLNCVPVDFQHYESNDAELADLLADNKIAELAEIDNKLLAEVFQDIDPNAIDIDITGYSEDEYNEIVSALVDATKPSGELDPDAPVDVQERAVSTLGDVWFLGKHRLMCGDSANLENINKLMGDVKADLVFTDPPYGVKRDKGFGGSGGFDGKGKPIKRRVYEDNWDNDTPPQETFDILLKSGKNAIIWGGNFFTDKLPVSGFWLVWDKHQTMPTFGDCELAWTNFPRKSVKKYDVVYNGLIGKEKERFHPTQKPVKLCADVINDFTNKDDLILDLFGGSGSTLVACEQLHRTCYMMELDPRYVDVIVKRYIGVTGKTDVTLLRNGKEIPVNDTGIMN